MRRAPLAGGAVVTSTVGKIGSCRRGPLRPAATTRSGGGNGRRRGRSRRWTVEGGDGRGGGRGQPRPKGQKDENAWDTPRETEHDFFECLRVSA